MRDAYARLLETGALGAHIPIETGYFLFGEIREPHEQFLCLYAPSFELDGHLGYVRVNVLNSDAVDALAGAASSATEPRTPRRSHSERLCGSSRCF
jgi:hypothetical protein